MIQINSSLGLLVLLSAALAVPVKNDEEINTTEATPLEETATSSLELSNNTGQDLLVIRQVVYEIGILTNTDNETDTTNQTQEVINVSFFDPGHNGSVFDLSNIPVPIQTNVSGVSVTGVVPANFGVLNLLENGTLDATNFPILPNKQVKVTHNISTIDKTKGAVILSGLPNLLGLDTLLENVSTSHNEATTNNSDIIV